MYVSSYAGVNSQATGAASSAGTAGNTVDYQSFLR